VRLTAGPAAGTAIGKTGNAHTVVRTAANVRIRLTSASRWTTTCQRYIRAMQPE